MLSRSELGVLCALSAANHDDPWLSARQIAAEAGICVDTARAVVTALTYTGLASRARGRPGTWRITEPGRAALRAQGVEVPDLSTRA